MNVSRQLRSGSAVLILGCTMPMADALELSHGPMAGAITTDSAKIWSRWSGQAEVFVQYRKVGTLPFTRSASGNASADGDWTATSPLAGLAPGTTYEYHVVGKVGSARTPGPTHYFRTRPASASALSFSVVTDFALSLQPSAALAMAASPRPDFVAVIGDWDHRGPSRDHHTGKPYPPKRAPDVLENMRAMHRDTRSASSLIGAQVVAGFIDSSAANPQLPMVYVWDDHDYCQNNTGADCPFKPQALQSLKEYFIPAADNGWTDSSGCGAVGAWQHFDHAGLASIFVLDARSNRVDEAAAESPSTLLGSCQLQWLIAGLRASKQPWKFVLSPVPFNPGTKTYDGWGRFAGERLQLVDAIQEAGLHNVVFISGDIHSGGAIDDGTHSGAPEISVPHANMPYTTVNTYCRGIRSGVPTLISEPGTWTIGGLQDPNLQIHPMTCLGKSVVGATPGPLPPPPYPLDGTDNPGYVHVDVDANGARIEVRDAAGAVKTGVLADGTSVPMQLVLH
jgi:alkaline phosphatase D